MYNNLSNSVPVADFYFKTIPTSSLILSKILFAFIIALVFAEVGYTLGIIFKNVIVGMVLIVLYVSPIIRFNILQDSLNYFAKKVFDFIGVITVKTPEDITLIEALFVILFTIIISFSLNMAFVTRRSSYNN